MKPRLFARRNFLVTLTAVLLLPVTSLLARKPLKGGTRTPGYHADAVSLDGTTKISIASLNSPSDNGKAIASVWLYDKSVDHLPVTWTVDPTGVYVSALSFGDSTSLFASFGASDGSYLYTTNGAFPSSPGTFVNIISACDLRASPPVLVVKKNGITVGEPINQSGALSGASSVHFNGASFVVGKNSVRYLTGYLSDLQVWSGVNGLDIDGTMPISTERLFRTADGKPVPTSVANASLGNPIVLHSGPAASFGTNQGTAGSAATTGTLTNALISPSD